MAATRSILSIVSLIFLGGAIVMMFFVILSGATYSSPENQIYFLQTSTVSGSRRIPGAPNPARWTYFALCGVNDKGHNANCRSRHPAFPFDPPRNTNFDTTTGVPSKFIGTHDYYYESRFMWVFYLIALFFTVVAFFTCFLAVCARLGAYITAVSSAIAFFFQTITASLMTAWTIQGRNGFRNDGYDAKLGVKAYAFTWTSMALLFLTTVFLCLAGATGGSRRKETTTTTSSGGGFFAKRRFGTGMFSRKRSTRSTASRGSFIDGERNGRGIKEEYD